MGSSQNEVRKRETKAKGMQVLMIMRGVWARVVRWAEMAGLWGQQGAVGLAGAFNRGFVLAPYQKV